MKTDLLNAKNEKIGTAELPEEIFARKWNPTLVHQILESMRANLRKPVAHAKGRGEVRGGGRKPWRQKGTGRARHGSIRSPLWPGGGVSHGPVKERDFEKKINKKMRRAALFTALSKKVADKELIVVDNLSVSEPKTKMVAGMLKHFTGKGFLIVPKPGEKNIFRASSNIPKVKALAPSSLNVYDVLRHKTILLDQEAISAIKETYKA